MHDSPRAQLSAGFRALFPAGVVAAELQGQGDATQLLAAEAACLGKAVPKRVAEYAAGRLCARLALAQLGITDFALLAAADRRPLWPPAIVGSITHTSGLCAAVVAPRSRFRGLGVDTETVGQVHAELWSRICVAPELAWLESLPEPRRAAAATLVFAAKESFYKCQSPLTDDWLEFEDLSVQVTDFEGAAGPGPSGSFQVVPLRALALAGIAKPPYVGRFRLHGEFVSAGVAIEA
jgi:4'-phosphopantetheinyl transferase EntD